VWHTGICMIKTEDTSLLNFLCRHRIQLYTSNRSILPLLAPAQLYRATTRPNVHVTRVTSAPEAHVVRAQVVPMFMCSP
jgi:hypothetical protein